MCSRHVSSCQVDSPFGAWHVESCQEGLHRLTLVEMRELDLTVPVHIIDQLKPPAVCVLLQDWMSAYFQSVLNVKALEVPPVCPSVFHSGRFREKVWREIYENLHIGETASYGEIATRVGSPGASQAWVYILQNILAYFVVKKLNKFRNIEGIHIHCVEEYRSQCRL